MLSQKIILGAAGNAAGSDNYWFWQLTGSNHSYGYGITLDGDDNAYIAGEISISGTTYSQVVKVDKDANTIAQKRYGQGSITVMKGIAWDNANHLYAAGYSNYTGTGFYNAIMQKLDLNLNTVWTRCLDGGGLRTYEAVACDSSGYPYVTGADKVATNYGGRDAVIDKYNTNGNHLYQRRWGPNDGSSTDDEGFGISVNSQDEAFVAGRTSKNQDGGGGEEAILVKTNSSGSFGLAKYMAWNNSDRGWDIAHDSRDYYYVVGESNGQNIGGGWSGFLVGYNSSNGVIGQYLIGSVNESRGVSVCCDSQNNVYALVKSYNGAVYEAVLYKFDSTFAYQWKRAFVRYTNSAQKNIYPWSIRVDSNDNLIIGGHTLAGPGVNNYFLIKYPNDGSMTGTWTDGAESIWIRNPGGYNADAGNLTIANLNFSQSTHFDSTLQPAFTPTTTSFTSFTIPTS